MAENKVKFGLKNVRYALVTIDDTGAMTYGTPVRIPGAVNLTLDPLGEISPFYADDIVYYQSTSNQGYEGTLEIALIPEQFEVEVLGRTKNTDSIVIENANDKHQNFALMYEFDGDVKATRHVLYNCSASKPSDGSSTKTNTSEPVTNELSFSASPRVDNFVIKARTTGTTGDSIYDAWYTKVYEATDEAPGI